jgi:carboxypeptidase C (cathepsin A)
MMPRLALLILLATTAVGHAADRTTQQSVTLPTGPLAFTAAVETEKLTTPDGKPAAEIVTTAFLHEAPDRPVTFAFNGGPGAASAWLDVGAIGPWRAPIVTPIVPSQDPAPVDNADTWLPFTDLVFIDPPGTGYSRALTDPKPFLSVDGDIRTFATTIRRWLEAHHRLGSPVFLAGES